MIQVSFTPEAIEALHHERFHHSHPRVRLKMEALYLKSQGLSHHDIARLCRIAETTLQRYLKSYREGGIEALKTLTFHRPPSDLAAHREMLAAAFSARPPATVAEAAARIKELTGIERKPTRVREFLKSLGMKPLKVGMIPAKADAEKQEAFKKKLWSPA
jgi:transposase